MNVAPTWALENNLYRLNFLRKGVNTEMQKKKIPTFKTEKDEREFWAREDSAEYIDWSKAKRAVFPHLKPSLKTISLRLPASMIEELKILANKKDVPYQSLMKLFLSERIIRELSMASSHSSKR
jgi:predicted DNA binding CopG/RHH family protein